MADNGFFDMIGKEFEKLSEQSKSSFWKELLDICSRLFKGEIDILKKAKNEEEALLKELGDITLIYPEDNNKIDESISKMEETIINKLKKLDSDDKNIENWLEYIEKLEDKHKKKEMESLVGMLQEASDNNNDGESDLDFEEIKKVSEGLRRKLEICKAILNGDNDVPENLKTKEEIIDSYNNVIKNNEGKTSSEIIGLIIEDLKKKQQREQ